MGRARNLGVWTQRIAVTALLALIVGFAVRVGSTSSQSLAFRDPLIWLASNLTGEVVQADAGSGEVTARVEVGNDRDSLAVVQHGPDALVLNRTTGEVCASTGRSSRSPSAGGAGRRRRSVARPRRQRSDRHRAAVIPVDPSNAEVGTGSTSPG
jgi:hypothetical protein